MEWSENQSKRLCGRLEPFTVDGLRPRYRRTVYPMRLIGGAGSIVIEKKTRTTVKTLRALATKLKIPGRSKARLKDDLLELIRANDGKQWK